LNIVLAQTGEPDHGRQFRRLGRVTLGHRQELDTAGGSGGLFLGRSELYQNLLQPLAQDRLG
jgi:hypothetical protein